MAIDSLNSSYSVDRNAAAQASASERQPFNKADTDVRAVERSQSGEETNTQTQKRDPEREAKAVQEAVDQIDQFVKLINSDLNIAVDDDAGRTVIKVINRENDEVIRQIPSEEVLSLIRRLNELADQVPDASSAAGGNSGVLLVDQA